MKLFFIRMHFVPDGSRELLPKESEGDAIMVSLFVDREDVILPWTDEFEQLVNESRTGQHYACKDSAKAVFKGCSTQKQLLTADDHPCIQYFEVGVGYDGY